MQTVAKSCNFFEIFFVDALYQGRVKNECIFAIFRGNRIRVFGALCTSVQTPEGPFIETRVGLQIFCFSAARVDGAPTPDLAINFSFMPGNVALVFAGISRKGSTTQNESYTVV